MWEILKNKGFLFERRLAVPGVECFFKNKTLKARRLEFAGGSVRLGNNP